MKKNKRIALIYTPVAALALFATFIAGANIGVQCFLNMDSSAKAMLLASELKAMREGNIEKLIDGQEISLDGEINRAINFQESGRSWVFFYLARNYDHDRYLNYVSDYRENHPSPTSKFDFSGDEWHQKEMKSYQLEVANSNKVLLERYGK